MFRSIQKNVLKTTLVLVGVLAVCGLVSTPTHALTYQQDIGVSFTFNPSISVTLSSADLIIPNLAPGAASDSNIITINVKTNNITGYTLNATVGNSTTYNTRDLKHQNNSITDKFSSINFGTIVATNTALADDTWGYSYSLDNGTNWIANATGSTSTGYSGLPLYSDETNITTLKETNGPIAATTGDDIKFKVAARASNEITSGEYNNVINFIAVANPEPQLEPINCSGANKICYSANSLGIVEGTMGEQSANANTSIDLLASNFSRTGYGFAGWSDAYDYATNPNAHFYGPNETITTPADMSAGLPLYAVWVQSAGTMQSDATSICSSLTAAPTNGTANFASVSALTDQRDNQTYAVAKLADGKCWMIENLRLESTNSDNSTGTLAQGYGASATYGNFSGLADAEPAWANNSTTANSLYYSGTQSGTATINIGTGSNPGYRFPRYNHDNTNSRASSPTANSAAMYSYGNYYTWHAAIADTTAYTTNNQSVTNTSICPAGWHLPKGGNKSNEANNEFWSLVVTGINGGVAPANYDSSTTPYYTGTAEAGPVDKKLRSYPNNFVYSGFVNSGSVSYRGSGGEFWSSTAYSSNGAYDLYLNSSFVYPGTVNGLKYYGRTVRCVASGV